MTIIHIYGEKAKELMELGAYGTFTADGISFTILYRSIEGRDCIDLEIVEATSISRVRQLAAKYA